MNGEINSALNMVWNMAEFINGRHRPVDVLWLYAGVLNDSMLFNIVEFCLARMGYL